MHLNSPLPPDGVDERWEIGINELAHLLCERIKFEEESIEFLRRMLTLRIAQDRYKPARDCDYLLFNEAQSCGIFAQFLVKRLIAQPIPPDAIVRRSSM